MSTQVYYAVDGDAKQLFMLQKSIESLRRFNKEVPVRVHSYGQRVDVELWTRLRTLGGVEVAHHALASCDPTQLKWRALGAEAADTVVYLDCDTYFFGDVADLIAQHQEHDFYAREEVGTEAHGKKYLIGTLLVQPQLDRALFAKLCGALESRAETVFNTGVMVFNRGAASRAAIHVGAYLDVFAEKFRSGDYAYPSTNRHIVEEVAAAIVLGRTGLSMGFLDRRVVPFFVEEAAYGDGDGCSWSGHVAWGCVVVHAWAAYYPAMLVGVEGTEAVRAMPGAEEYELPQ